MQRAYRSVPIAAALALLLLPFGTALAQTSGAAKQPAAAKAAKPNAKTHKVAIQVAANDPALMNLALNNAANVVQHYKAKGETVLVEVVTFGPGLHMLRDDTSPVKARVASLALEFPNLSFTACANTQANMSKQEDKPIKLVGEATLAPSGVVRLMELQGKGYAYIRP